MTINEFVELEKKPSTVVSVRALSAYDGIANTKESYDAEAKSAVILEGASKQSHEDTGDVEVVEGDAQTVYMEQCKAGVEYALEQKDKHATVEIDGLDLVCTFNNLTPKSKELFGGDTYTVVVSCDPDNPEKATVKDGYYAKKHIGYFITLQLNAALKVPNGDKLITLRQSKAKAGKTAKATDTEAELSL